MKWQLILLPLAIGSSTCTDPRAERSEKVSNLRIQQLPILKMDAVSALKENEFKFLSWEVYPGTVDGRPRSNSMTTPRTMIYERGLKSSDPTFISISPRGRNEVKPLSARGRSSLNFIALSPRYHKTIQEGIESSMLQREESSQENSEPDSEWSTSASFSSQEIDTSNDSETDSEKFRRLASE